MKTDAVAPLEQFRRYLAGQGLPATRQRLAVATTLWAAADRPSAEDVRRRVSARGVPVGLATVYRTLDLLVQSGLVQERITGEGFRRFEPVATGPVPARCVCTSCGAVSAFPDARLEPVVALGAAEAGFRPQRHRLEVYGLCRACQQLNPLAGAR